MDLNQLFFRYGVYYPITSLRGERVHRYLQAMRASQWASREELGKIQRRKLAALLGAARAGVPFYRPALERSHWAGETVLDLLKTLPFLTKADIQTSGRELLNTRCKGRYSIKTTGGSTGQAVTVRKSRDATAQETAASWRGFGWAGIEVGDKQARFWGVPMTPRQRLRAHLIDLVGNRRRFSAFAFTDTDLAAYTRELNRFKPRYFYGYVSMLDEYASYLRRNHVGLSFRPRAIVATAEVLTPMHRRNLQEAFCCEVYNEYGCGELGTIAHECENGNLHINAENLLVEIINGVRHCRPGEMGEIVVTELNNHIMPLIRYRLGDFGALSAQECACGRSLPILEAVAGRGYDLIYNREGKMFHGEFFMYVFEEIKQKGLGVKFFQVLQKSYEDFIVRVVPDEGYSAQTKELVRRRFADGYGEYAKLHFVEVDEIPRRPSGKMQLIVGLDSRTSHSGEPR